MPVDATGITMPLMTLLPGAPAQQADHALQAVLHAVMYFANQHLALPLRLCQPFRLGQLALCDVFGDAGCQRLPVVATPRKAASVQPAYAAICAADAQFDFRRFAAGLRGEAEAR